MAAVLIREGEICTETQIHSCKGREKEEAETGVSHLQTEKCQGVPAATGS